MNRKIKDNEEVALHLAAEAEGKTDMDTVRKLVLEEMDFRKDLKDEQVLDLIEHVLNTEGRRRFLPMEEKERLLRQTFNSIRRLDILQELIDDERITEIMVIGRTIFWEKGGEIRKWDKEFSSIEIVEDIAQRIAGANDKVLNRRHPITDARLSDGSRVHIVIAPVALEGPVITIRRFPEEPVRMGNLIEWGSITEEAAFFLETLVKAGYNLFISGGTGSGKTTFLNALGAYIPPEERVIVIEDTAELQIRGIPNLVRLEARAQNLEGDDEISIRQLVRTALRMRPDRIIIGEVRGEESIDLLQAMNTGHDGSLSTGHANSTKDMLSRLETMVLMGMEIPLTAVRRQIASGLDVLVHLGRMNDRSRKVLEISELIGVQEEIVTEVLFAYEDGRLRFKHPMVNIGKLKAAGLEIVLCDYISAC